MPKFLNNIDLAKNQLLNAVIHTETTPDNITNPIQGQIYYDSSAGEKSLYVFDGTNWLPTGQNSIQSLATETAIASGDHIAFSDESETGDINNKITINNLVGTGLQHVGTAAVADGDFFLFLDGGSGGTAKKEAVHDLATLFAGSGLTATNSVIAVETLNQNTTGTADKATHVLVANNESENEENEITFVEDAAAGGAQRGLESSAKATFNPSTGKITATGFIGALTGDASGNAATVTTNANLTGDVTSSGNATTIGAGTVHHAMLAEDIVSGQSAITAVAQADLIMVHDTSASAVKKITYNNLENDIFGNVSGDGTIAAGGALVVTKSDGDFTVTGDLIVSGTTTTINTANLTVEDNNIILSSGNTSGAAINGAGITLEGGSGDDATFTYSTTGPKFELKLGSSYEDLKVDTLHAAALTIPDNAVAVAKIAAGTLPTDVKVTNANWTGTDLTVVNGGTGRSTFTSKAILLGNGGSAINELTVGNTGQVLTIDGSGNPVFAANTGSVAAATVIGADQGNTADATMFLTMINAAGDGSAESLKTHANAKYSSESGVITAQGFAGSLTGAVTGNASTATTLAANTNQAVPVGTVELGHATDTTIARSAAGKATIEGNLIGVVKTFALNDTNPVQSNNNGAASTIFTITHAMGASRFYKVEVVQNSGNYDTVFADITRPSDTTILVTFASNVALDAYAAMVTRMA